MATICTIAVFLLGGSQVGAEENPKLKKAAEALGKAFVKAAHFTGTDQHLRKYSFRENTLYLTVDWKGGFLETPYTSEIEIKFKKVGAQVQIVDWDYDDDAIIRWNKQSIRALVRKYNNEK